MIQKQIFLPLSVLALVSACGGSPSTDDSDSDAADSGDGDGDGDGLTGGAGNSGGAGPGSGGAGPGSGGAGPGSGGAGPGSGGSGSASICPLGSESLTLDLAGVSLTATPGFQVNYPDFSNVEGPVWIGDSLYYSNISSGSNPPPSVIYKLTPGSDATVFVPDSGSNGLATDGVKLFAAMHSDGTVSTRELASPSPATVLAGIYDSTRFNSPNDLVVAADGTVYFTDPTYQAPSGPPQDAQRTYRVSGGTVTALEADNAPSSPNGITLSLDETSLYIGGGNGLYRYTLNSNGTLETPGTVITTENIPGFTNIDGLGRDCAGNIYVAVHGNSDVVVINPANEEIGKLDVPSGSGVTNIAFGGADRMTLYVTSLGQPPSLVSATLNVPGYPY